MVLSISLEHVSAEKSDTLTHRFWTLNTNFHYSYVVENYSQVPKSRNPFFIEINPSIQTAGNKEWQHIFGFPKVGCSFLVGDLGNRTQLGTILGILPNLTFNAVNARWYAPRIKLGLGLAYFTKTYGKSDTMNYYIGSHITALAQASIFIQPKLNDHFELTAGIAVSHASNGHYQVPNLGINLPSVFIGLIYHPDVFTGKFLRREISVPPSKVRFNVRAGIGVHELARTLGPVGTPKYAVYVTDFYLSKRFGKVSNVQAGLEINHYNSFYNYIVKNDFFKDGQQLKATVFTAFLAHELMIGRFSLLTQGGINLYNRFYDQYILMYKSEQGLKSELKKYISTRLGTQYYLFDPRYCTRNNIFVGAYIKANFGQADFICTQIGFVF
ncbi:MAG TPA: acyloxyacyl hydrolase [Bacteroidales bacterium]